MNFKKIRKVIFAIFLLLLLILVLFIVNDNDNPSMEANLIKDNEVAISNANALNSLQVRGIDKSDYTWGEKRADVELIVYSDLTCPFCLRFNKVVEQIKEEFPKDVRIAYRHYIVEGHDNSLVLANVVECAGEQKKFIEMYNGLMNSDSKDYNLINSLVKEFGINREKFDTCLTSEKYMDKILNQKKEAKAFGVLGTPASFLNGQSLPGAYQFDDFEDQAGRKHFGMKSLILQKLNK